MSMKSQSDEKSTLAVTLDGRRVAARPGETILSLARRCGLSIPTLCDHPALEPVGACRLCLVEVVRGERRKIVTACNHPVSAGLEVVTASPALERSRRMTLEALLARCPGVAPIRELAAAMGVTRSRLPAGDDDCILCGLCTRVCQTYATSAITTLGRGREKRIGFFGDEAPAECVGCLACAEICPTGCIGWEREGEELRIWHRTFPVAVCRVEEEKCRGCGLCEQACPFAVARIGLRVDGPARATIDPAACKGCGVCLSACPTGAITQPGAPAPAAGGADLLVVSCGRSRLAGPFASPLPAGTEVLELPCTGGITVARLLAELAAGRDGVLVMGRHEETCRLEGAEEQAREAVDRADRLARLAGLGAGRVAFAQPGPGVESPPLAAAEFLSRLAPTPLAEARPGGWEDSVDGALAILGWLAGRPELEPAGESWLAGKGLPPAREGAPVLLAHGLPFLDLLFGEDLLPLRPGDLLLQALEVLASRGIEAGVALDGLLPGGKGGWRPPAGTPCYSLCPECTAAYGEAGVEVTLLDRVITEQPPTGPAGRIALDAGDERLVRLARACGLEPVDAGPPVVAERRFTLTAAETRALEERLLAAARQGAPRLLLPSPAERVQHQLFCREGAWRRSGVEPVMGVTLAARLAAGTLEEAR